MSVRGGPRPRLLVAGCPWPPQTFLRRLFAGLSERFEVLVASRTRFSDPTIARLGLPRERWPRPVRIAATAAAGLPALGTPAGRRLLEIDGWRRLPYLRRSVDVIYFPFNSSAVDHAPLLKLGLPSVISCRGSQVQVAPHQPERSAQTAGLAASFKSATLVHCVSDATLEASVRLGLDPSKARVIRPAVDVDAFRPAGADTPGAGSPGAGSPGPPWRLVAVGGLSWLKGFEDVLLAVRRLRDRGHDVELDLLGDGPDRQRLRFAVHDLGLDDVVRMPGQVPPEEIADRLRRSRVFILSSLSEGISNAALEAMACGVPVVSTRCGGMEEAIVDGESGLLVPLQSPDALAQAVERLLTDDDLRRRLSAGGRRRVEAEFRLERQVQAFIGVFLEAIAPNI
ncbi:MAG: glycosyltransferase family 4 protein [Acidobacteriota bacterium]